MQNNEMVEKKKALWDGNEVSGLVSVAEITREKRTVEVPSFRRIRDVQSGIVKMPQLTLVYKLERNTNTMEFFETFFDENEVKDLELIRTDAHGVAFGRKMYIGCEVISISEPAYDAASPDYAKTTIVIAPEDIINI
jgi:hypothetical protein